MHFVFLYLFCSFHIRLLSIISVLHCNCRQLLTLNKCVKYPTKCCIMFVFIYGVYTLKNNYNFEVNAILRILNLPGYICCPHNFCKTVFHLTICKLFWQTEVLQWRPEKSFKNAFNSNKTHDRWLRSSWNMKIWNLHVCKCIIWCKIYKYRMKIGRVMKKLNISRIHRRPYWKMSAILDFSVAQGFFK